MATFIQGFASTFHDILFLGGTRRKFPTLDFLANGYWTDITKNSKRMDKLRYVIGYAFANSSD
jgi:hypothetical protein